MLDQQLVVGKTYRFKFKSEFERHGVCTSSGVTCLHRGNGIFRLEEIATIHDILMQGVSMYSNFFKPLGMSEAEANAYFNGKPDNAYTKEYITQKIKTERTYTEVVPTGAQTGDVKAILRKAEGERAEWVESGASVITRQFFEELNYSRFPIYKLVDVVDPDDILYVPEKAIEGFPEVGIREYQDMTLAIDIGYWDNPGKLDGMLKSIRERLAAYGVQPLDIRMFSADSKWMNPDEFKEVSKLQVPGKLKKITEENYKDYLHNSVVIDGTLKSIVVDDSNIDPDTQVSLDAIICKKAQVIGPNLMLEEVPETSLVFESGNQYYVEVSAGRFRKLNEGVDWNPGYVIPHYTETSDTSRDGSKKYFVDNGPVYEIIGSGLQTIEERVNEVLAYVAAGNALHRCTEYIQEVEGTALNIGATYLRKNSSGGFTVVQIASETYADGSYYTPSDKFVEATEEYVRENPSEVYYIKASDHSYVESSISDMSKLYEKKVFKYLNFASNKMLALVGKTCEYTNPFGIRTTTQLDAEGIVVLATAETPMTIANQVVANLYKGRWFEYTVDEIDPVSGDVISSATYALEISPTNWQEIQQYKGNIIGTGGIDCSIWREVNIITDELSRSYYRLYIDEFREKVQLQAKVDALERVINTIQS